MATPFIKSSFSSGEVSPSLYGRVDLQKWHSACSVSRNMFVSYKGGLLSRGGLGFAGFCKQVAGPTSVPPRNIEFTFNIFQSYILEFGELYMRVVANGAYVTESAFNVTAITQANPGQFTVPGNNFANGDWIFLSGLGGMTQLDGVTGIVANTGIGGSGTFTLTDYFGAAINTSFYGAFTSGGTAARIYTLTTPYHAVDLPYLKYTQSADVMSLTCVNQQTQTEYPTYELTRLAANSWTIAQPTFASSVGAPASSAATPSVAWSSGNPGPVAYGYVVTAVDAITGDESIASAIAVASNSVDIAATFGTITVSWTAPTLKPNGVSGYNVYRATPDYTNAGNFVGQLFGFVGSTTGALTWQDTNIIADFTITPPLHLNPFSGAGNSPGVVAYFQQRRGYAYSLNNPDQYEFSQPGSFLNFDSADPPIDSDAITGTPWGEQINGIQHMLPMPGGLVTLTGKTTWQVSGTGGAGSPITPSQQSAQAQEGIGCSPTLPPLRIRYNILFADALSSIVCEVNYNFFFNIYTGEDITVLSSQLFQGFTLTQWDFSFDPYRVIWAVRNDGKLLSLTYVQEQEVKGWARHDTNGVFASVAVASEPPVNAPYFIVKRFVEGEGKWAYMQERMDNRLWSNVEQSMCLDSALSYPQPAPNANLVASAAHGTGGVKLGAIIVGGSNYSNAPAFNIIDNAGTGTGASVSAATVVGGVITALTIVPGENYGAPVLQCTDATGQGFIASLIVDNSVTFTADSAVFDGVNTGVVGQVIRAGGGIGTVSSYVSPTQIIAQVFPQASITSTVTDDPNNTPLPIPSGAWTITTPVQTVFGLGHLEGMTVNALADGTPALGLTVQSGTVTLPNPASQILVGLPFIAQAQSLHADLPGAMVQGKRKRITGVTVRLANSRGVKVGQDQPIAAQQRNQMEVPWDQAPNLMTPIDYPQNLAGAGNAVPLFSGDKFVVIAGDYSTTDGQPSPGMVAIEQDMPLPVELLAFVPLAELGDVPG